MSWAAPSPTASSPSSNSEIVNDTNPETLDLNGLELCSVLALDDADNAQQPPQPRALALGRQQQQQQQLGEPPRSPLIDLRLNPEVLGAVDRDPKRWPATPTAFSMLIDMVAADIRLIQPMAQLPETLVAQIVTEIINRGRLDYEMSLVFRECGHPTIEQAFAGLKVESAFRPNLKESGCRPFGWFR